MFSNMHGELRLWAWGPRKIFRASFIAFQWKEYLETLKMSAAFPKTNNFTSNNTATVTTPFWLIGSGSLYPKLYRYDWTNCIGHIWATESDKASSFSISDQQKSFLVAPAAEKTKLQN